MSSSSAAASAADSGDSLGKLPRGGKPRAWSTADTAVLIETERERHHSDSDYSDGGNEESHREVITEYDLAKHHKAVDQPSVPARVKAYISRAWDEFDWKVAALGKFPFLELMPGYNRSQFVRDFLCGLTVSVVIVPQSLAYTVLAGMPASWGLFASFVPPLMYAFIGGSRQMSVGPFALISLMLSQSVVTLVPNYTDILAKHPEEASMLAAECIMAITFLVGIFTLALALLRFGWIISFFSKPALGGFLCASAYVICTTQAASVLQIKVPADASFIEAWIKMFSHLPHANGGSVIIGVLGIVILLVLDKLFGPPRFKVPLPWPLALVIVSTLISYLGGFHKHFGVRHSFIAIRACAAFFFPLFVRISPLSPSSLLSHLMLQVKVVQTISNEFPKPILPHVPDWGTYVPAALIVAIVNYVVCMSVVKQFASEHGYTVDANNEMFALGVLSFVGSFFAAFVPSGSLSRSAVANTLKPATQLWNLVLFAIIALCIGAFAPLLYHLPSATLASVIIASFKTLVRFLELLFSLLRSATELGPMHFPSLTSHSTLPPPSPSPLPIPLHPPSPTPPRS